MKEARYEEHAPRKFIKSSILAPMVAITQQFNVMNKSEELREARVAFGTYAKDRLLKQLDRIEIEVYRTFDYVDSTLLT